MTIRTKNAAFLALGLLLGIAAMLWPTLRAARGM